MGRPSDDYFVRASGLGDIMKASRSKKEPFGKVAIASILASAYQNKHGIYEEITGKPLEKGIVNEDEALDMLCSTKGWKDCNRKKERMFNDYITGEPDLLDHDKSILADVKNSFTTKSFPVLADTSDLKKHHDGYYYQMQAYMWLSGIKTSYLAYCLTSFPEHMIVDAIKKRVYYEYALPSNYGKDLVEIDTLTEDKIRKQMTYDHIPKEKRIVIFKVDYDAELIENVKNRIVEARKIYDTIYESI